MRRTRIGGAVERVADVIGIFLVQAFQRQRGEARGRSGIE